jgi:hypothetical protein
VLDRVFEYLQREQIVRIKIEADSLDSTIVKVHPDGTGAVEKRPTIHWEASRRVDHPRDLFDVGLLLADERVDERLWRTFLVYLTCSPKPAWEMLTPRAPTDFEAGFEAHFKGMTSEPVSVVALLESREHLLARVAHWLDKPSRAFLQSVEDEKPDFSLIGLAHAAELPGVRRKLHNLAQRTAAERAADRQQLDETLARIAGAR